jgi:ribonuclease P protein component
MENFHPVMTLDKQRFLFPKKERLCSRKAIETIFESGKAINESPLRFLWTESSAEDKIPLKIAISVPKRNFKRAVDRNKIKRQIREAYRLNKHKVLTRIENTGRKFSGIIIYTGKEHHTGQEMEAKIIVTLQRFAKEACKK